MPDFNTAGVTAKNLDAFYEALGRFANKRGRVAAARWLFKLNPLAHDHLSTEYHFTGDGYSSKMAQTLVFGEYDHAPLPVRCPCGGVAWYKATFGAHRCMDCSELVLEADNIYLEDLMEVRA